MKRLIHISSTGRYKGDKPFEWRFYLGLEFQWRDMWIGFFSSTGPGIARSSRINDFYLCIIPMFPIHLELRKWEKGLD